MEWNGSVYFCADKLRQQQQQQQQQQMDHIFFLSVNKHPENEEKN